MLKVMHIVGARPNYMKTAPIWRVMAQCPDLIEQTLVHTGQHYDVNMSDVFFTDLGLPKPAYYLGVGSGSHAQQTARTMTALEPVVQEFQPDLVLVVGDVNSTIAAALVCAKLSIPVGHVEAGLRSFDREMPEEINRILTDQISDLLFTPSPDADANLLHEGISASKIFRVGNVMIDSLVRMIARSEELRPALQMRFGFDRYILVTLHRPANVDEVARLTSIMNGLIELSHTVPVVFPVHPRTRERMKTMNLTIPDSIRLLEPLSYLEFLALESKAALVITDSGGIQEETTYLGIPCLTVRPNTERPITIDQGTNRLVAGERDTLVKAGLDALTNRPVATSVPDLWDGNAAKRIVDTIIKWKAD